jgi:hypothetical protein
MARPARDDLSARRMIRENGDPKVYIVAFGGEVSKTAIVHVRLHVETF